MIRLSPGILDALRDHAQQSYPEECCGLLVGRCEGEGGFVVTGLRPSVNLHQNPRRAFEVDPKIRFEAIRAEQQGADPMIGHYHSHPDHPPVPSERDLASAHEPDLIWLIMGVDKGRPGPARAWKLKKEGGAFDSLPLIEEKETPS